MDGKCRRRSNLLPTRTGNSIRRNHIEKYDIFFLFNSSLFLSFYFPFFPLYQLSFPPFFLLPLSNSFLFLSFYFPFIFSSLFFLLMSQEVHFQGLEGVLAICREEKQEDSNSHHAWLSHIHRRVVCVNVKIGSSLCFNSFCVLPRKECAWTSSIYPVVWSRGNEIEGEKKGEKITEREGRSMKEQRERRERERREKGEKRESSKCLKCLFWWLLQ